MVGRIGASARVLPLFVAAVVACGGSSKRSQREAGEPSAGQPSGASAGEGGTQPVAGTSGGGVSGTNRDGGTRDAGAAGAEAGGGVSGTAGSGAGGVAASSGAGTIHPAGGAAGMAGMAGMAGAAGAAGSSAPECTNGECWDGMHCETALDALGCAAMHDPSPDSPPPEEGADCAGSIDNGYIYMRQALDHSLLCAYGAFGPLVYAARRDAAPVHCNQRSRDVTAGQAPKDLRIRHYASYRGCTGVAESSVSPLFNELFPEIPPQDSCTPAQDECRGRVSLLVCEDSECEPCTSDTQCAAEYPYLGAEVSCSGGVCRLDSLVGACSTEAPTTACNITSGAFACIARRCVRCTAHEDCVNTTGNQQSTCSSDGTCIAL